MTSLTQPLRINASMDTVDELANVGPYWDTQPYVVIQFDPDWLREVKF